MGDTEPGNKELRAPFCNDMGLAEQSQRFAFSLFFLRYTQKPPVCTGSHNRLLTVMLSLLTFLSKCTLWIKSFSPLWVLTLPHPHTLSPPFRLQNGSQAPVGLLWSPLLQAPAASCADGGSAGPPARLSASSWPASSLPYLRIAARLAVLVCGCRLPSHKAECPL